MTDVIHDINGLSASASEVAMANVYPALEVRFDMVQFGFHTLVVHSAINMDTILEPITHIASKPIAPSVLETETAGENATEPAPIGDAALGQNVKLESEEPVVAEFPDCVVEAVSLPTSGPTQAANVLETKIAEQLVSTSGRFLLQIGQFKAELRYNRFSFFCSGQLRVIFLSLARHIFA